MSWWANRAANCPVPSSLRLNSSVSCSTTCTVKPSAAHIGIVELLGREGDRSVENGLRGSGGRDGEQRDRASQGRAKHDGANCPCEVGHVCPPIGSWWSRHDMPPPRMRHSVALGRRGRTADERNLLRGSTHLAAPNAGH